MSWKFETRNWKLSLSDLTQQIFSCLPPAAERGAPLKLLTIPGHSAPRWLVQDAGKALAPTLANWSPYRAASRMMWASVQTAFRSDLLSFFPGVETIVIPSPSTIDWRALAWRGDEMPAVSIYIGTPGPTQKAVIHLVNQELRQCEAIVKVPLSPQAKQAIAAEAETLRTLAERQYDRAPALLHVDAERGLSTQQFIPGKAGSRRLKPEYLDLLRSLIVADKYTTLSAHAMISEKALEGVAAKDGQTLRDALGVFDDDRPLPVCWLHGDFAPWNVRQGKRLPPILIDWEDAEANGLPLQDAYHFLHIQNFLFHARPMLHADALTDFGRSVGLTPRLCRTLEIAYLAHSYLRCCSRGDNLRSTFLMRTLANAIGEYAISTSLSKIKPTAHSIRDAADHLRNFRASMFASLMATLNEENISYCVLSGYECAPENSPHDVDVMVRAEDRPRIPDLLARTARLCGARLVQDIQHETTASYFILARTDGEQVAHLDVDCYTDYRRNTRTWLLAKTLIANRRRHRGFYVPSVADEFTYYLLKKVLKQGVSQHEFKRLRHLLARDPAECERQIARYWPAKSLLLQRMITEQILAGFRRELPELLRELQALPCAKRRWSGCRNKRAELARWLRRGLRPTGMYLEIAGGTLQQRTRLAEELSERLAPVFRRTHLLIPSSTRGVLGRILQIFAARVQSTLVIAVDEAMKPTSQRSLTGPLLRLSQHMLSPDMEIVLDETHPGATQIQREGRTLRMNVAAFPSSIQQACEAVLLYLAARLEKRLGLTESPIRSSGPHYDVFSSVEAD